MKLSIFFKCVYKEKGSRTFNKIMNKLQKEYDKRTNKLNDFVQKLSTKIVKELDTVVIEDNWSSIKVLIGGEQNMIFPTMKFKEILKYEFNWYKPDCTGLVTVNQAYTSKTCNYK